MPGYSSRDPTSHAALRIPPGIIRHPALCRARHYRHTYATELVRGGLNLVGVMKLLGHRTIKMTLRYVKVTNEDLGRDYLVSAFLKLW